MLINSLFNALSGLRTSSSKLQTSANNVANLQTPGFKKSRAEVSDVQSGGAEVSAISRNSSPGSLIPTSNPLDLAINGDGFFQVSLQGGGTGFTRAGNFKTDSQGQLTTPAGNPLIPPVTIPAGATGISIDRGGQVSAIVGGSPVSVGQIELAQFSNPGGLSAEGGNVFTANAGSGNPVTGTPGSGSFGTVINGALESSNVDIAEEVVGQIVAKTSFKANLAVIRTSKDMLGALLDIKS
jgi:flagellar basal-body rod protein FlgG